jgi:hypothetical protein
MAGRKTAWRITKTDLAVGPSLRLERREFTSEGEIAGTKTDIWVRLSRNGFAISVCHEDLSAMTIVSVVGTAHWIYEP